MYGRKKEYVDMEIEARMWVLNDNQNPSSTV
jgi:hypothetical protein